MKRAVVVFLVCLGACNGEDKRDAERIAIAVGRIRGETGAPVAELRAAPCRGDVCKAKEACLASLDATAQAIALKHEVEKGLGALESGQLDRESPEAKALPKKLDEASRLLDEGHDKLPACDAELADLRRRYRF